MQQDRKNGLEWKETTIKKTGENKCVRLCKASKMQNTRVACERE